MECGELRHVTGCDVIVTGQRVLMSDQSPIMALASLSSIYFRYYG